MRSAAVILAGLLAGVLVALGVLAAFLFVGPDPVGLRPTPSPAPSIAASPSASPSPSAPAASPSASPSAAGSGPASASPAASASASASAGPAPSGSNDSQTGFQVGQPAPALVVPQLGAGGADVIATTLDRILPGVTVTP